MGNWGLADKLEHLKSQEPLSCEYSRLALEKMQEAFLKYPRVLGLPEKEAKQTLSRYFRTDFQQEYARYVAGMVHALAVRLPQKLSYS